MAMGKEPKGFLTMDDYNNLNNCPMDDVWTTLKVKPATGAEKGLSLADAEERLKEFGPNKLEEVKENKILKFLGFMWNPLSWVMEAAAIMALVFANGPDSNGVTEPPDWYDFVGIILLLLINSTISFIEENNAGNAAAALMAKLSPEAKCFRGGEWLKLDASELVPGDIINFKLGDIIPADCRLLEGDPMKIDQAALTGESLPTTKGYGDVALSGTTVKQGELDAVVFATGTNTFLGKAADLVSSTHNEGHFQKVLRAIGNFCIASIAVGIVIEIIVMYAIQKRNYREGINNLLVLLIGGIPIAMPTVLSVTMAIGSHDLSTQGAITKRITAIEEMAGMDILCSDKTGTLTLNKLTVDKTIIETYVKDVDQDTVVLLAARAARTENQDAIDSCIVGCLADPSEARAGITELHFFPFNPDDKYTAITYSTEDGKVHRAYKGAPWIILEHSSNRSQIETRVNATIDDFAGRGLRGLGVARQEVTDANKDKPGGPWEMVGLMPLFDPPRHDSAETIAEALKLGVSVKMITGDHLAIGKETARRLGMGTNMYPASALLGSHANPELAGMDVDELIEQADGFANVMPEHKYEIVARLQKKGHLTGMTGDGVNDAPALKKADIGIAVDDATDAARAASDIVLTEPGLSVIIHAVLTARCIFQRMKNYTIYAVSITIRIVLGFMLICLIWQYDFSPFMVLIIAVLNDGTILTISKDRVVPSPMPDSWKLGEIFGTGIVLGTYQAIMTVIFFWAAWETDWFPRTFGVGPDFSADKEAYYNHMMSALYLQVSILSQALIFVTRSIGFSYMERPGVLLMLAFVLAQLIATFIAVYANWGFADIAGCGWGWAGVVWLYSLVTYVPMDFLKFLVRYVISGNAWNLVTNQYTTLTNRPNMGVDERQREWAAAQRTLHGLDSQQGSAAHQTMLPQLANAGNADAATAAARRAQLAKMRDQTLHDVLDKKFKEKGIDANNINPSYTL